MLVDTNLILYSSKPKFAHLRPLFLEGGATVSRITHPETLGYPRITSQDERYFKSLFALLKVQEIDTFVITKAIELRKSKKMSVADAIIAATALLRRLELYTQNGQDFDWIEGLRVVDPIQAKQEN